jgi:serine/threonine-protein kinase
MGEVYLANQESLARHVVLKFVARHLAGDALLARRFAREARAAARVNHPNLVTIYSVHEAEGLAFYAMEYVEGDSLDRIIEREAPLAAERALGIAAQAAEALGCAHAAGILHRDVKPSNLLVMPSGHVKVVDFGIAKVLGDRTALTEDGTFLGTLSYASPEQCEGAELDSRTDIYSLGVVLYEMLAGRPPHTGDTPLSLIRRIANEPAPDLRDFNPDVPDAVRELIARMIEKARDRRPPDCGVLAEELRRLASGKPPAADRPGDFATTAVEGSATAAHLPAASSRVVPLGRPFTESELKAPARRRRKRILIVTGVIVLLLMVAGSMNNKRRERERQAPAAKLATTAAAIEPGAPTPGVGPMAQPASTESPLTPTAPAIAPTAPVMPTRASVQNPPATPATRTPVAPPPPAPTAMPLAASAAASPGRVQPFPPAAALQVVPQDRDLVLAFNVRALLDSPLMRSNESKVFSPTALARLDAFFGYYGVDWRRDIDHLVLAGQSNVPDSLAVIFHGRFNPNRIFEQARRLPGYQKLTHNGWTIHAANQPDRGRLEGLVMLRGDVVACGAVPTLRQVCDAAENRAPSLLAHRAVRSAAATVSESLPFWAIGVPRPGGNPAMANLDAFALRARLTPDLLLDGIAWPRNPAEIEQAYKGLSLIVDLWRNNKQNADLRKLGANLAVGRTADTLSVTLRVPYADLVRLLDAAAAQGNYPFK